MATKPLTNEAIALTEKKMDMSLDDIIKLSKTNIVKPKKQRDSNKGRRFPNGNQDKALKMRQYMDSRSIVRQGVLAQRRSNFRGNSFPLASEAARKAVVAPFPNRSFNRNRAPNWNKPRLGGPLRRRGNFSNGANAAKQQRQQQQPQQQQPRQQQLSRTGDVMPQQKPKTLDSLFANMKQQRMKAVNHSNNGAAGRGGAGRGGAGNQRRQPWLRGRFGEYRN